MIIFGIRAHYAAIGGVENSIRNLVRVAAARKVKTVIVCRQPMDKEILDTEASKRPANTELEMYPDDTNFSIFRRLISLLSGGVILANVYKGLYQKCPYAVVIARHHAHVLAAKKAGFKTIKYLVPSIIGNQLREEAAEVTWTAKARLFLHAKVDGFAQSRALCSSEVFVFSQTMADQVNNAVNRGSARIPVQVVRPGVDKKRFNIVSNREKVELRKKLNLPESKKIFLFVGRLVKAKGLDFFIRAMEELPDNCFAVLVGEGDQLTSLLDSIRVNSLEEKISYCGRTSRVEDFYKACDVFVMSSTYEPLGQTLLEAIACGMSVVAFHRSTGVNTATHELNIDHVVHYADSLDGKGLATAMRNSLDSPSTASPTISAEYLDGWDKLWDDLIPAAQ